MEHKLFIANLPDTVTEDDLRDLLAAHGEVTDVQLRYNESTGESLGRGFVTIDAESSLPEVAEQVMTHTIEGRRVLASPAELPPQKEELSDDLRAFAEQVADTLGETEDVPKKQIYHAVRLCGPVFVQALLDKTLVVEAGEGMWMEQYQRRRTPGGVFFYLLRKSVSSKVKAVVLVNTELKKKKRKKPKKAPAKQQAAAKSPPRPAPAKAAPTGEALQQQLVALRSALQDAKNQLEAVKTGQGDPGVGVFQAMKNVVDVQQKLTALLSKHPELKP